MNAYEAKKQARIERLQAAAERAEERAEAKFSQASRMASVIPFGQPILVGHHSEGRDRRYRERIGKAMDKGCEEMKKAEYYADRAAAAENNTAISSDDPEACDKLAVKIAEAEKLQETMREFNKAMRKGDNARMLELLGTQARVDKMLEPDFCGRKGFADYQLQNNNANIRRMKERQAQLAKRANDEETEREINGVRIVENVDENRLQMFFDGKPSEVIRKELKGSGFRWSPMAGAWQRHRSSSATWNAERIAKLV